MRKGKTILLIAIAALVIVAAMMLKEVFRTPTPLEYAQKQSGLMLPKDMKLTKFINDFSGPTGNNLFRQIDFYLTEEQKNMLVRECAQKNYTRLPFKNDIFNPGIASDNEKGYYKIEYFSKNKNDYAYTLLLTDKNELHLFKCF